MGSALDPVSSRTPALTARGAIFLALLVPVWTVGVVRGERITAYIGQLAPIFGEDLARFERVRSALAGVDRAVLLLDRRDLLPAAERFFPAQYKLAPTVLQLASEVNAVVGPSWTGAPLVVLCAFDDPGRRTAALAELEAAAGRRGVRFEARSLDPVVTWVRLGGG